MTPIEALNFIVCAVGSPHQSRIAPLMSSMRAIEIFGLFWAQIPRFSLV